MRNIVVPCVVLLILGLAFLIVGTRLVLEGKRSDSWPQVEGRIVKSTVKHERKKRQRPGSSFQNKPAGTSFYPVIQYAYSVGGTKYEGTRIGIVSRGYAWRRKAQDAAAKYPVGKNVQVHYDASSPGQSMLETGSNALLYLLPVLGAIFMMAAPIVFFAARNHESL